MISCPPFYYAPNDPDAPDTLEACSQCGTEGLDEDSAFTVEGETMCAGCGLSHLLGLAKVVVGHDYRTAAKVEAANRLDAEILTLKALVREVARAVNESKRRHP